jgi:hypothetical protein
MKSMGKISSILSVQKPLISILAFLGIVFVLFNPFFNWDGIIYHFDTQSMKAFRGNVEIREASSAFYGDINLIKSYVEYIYEANGLLVFLVLLVGSIYCCLRFPYRFWIFITPMVTYYIFFLRLHGTHHLRYILPVFLILTWHAGKILADLLEFKRIPKPLSKALVLLILCSSIIYGFSVDVLYARDPRYELEKWMETNIPAEALTLAVKPGYSLPRFRSGQNVKYLTLWDYNGNQIADIVDLDPEYIVISMAIQRRQERREEVENFFTNRGYQSMATFQARVPFYGVDIEDLRAVNPEIVVLKRSANKQGRPESLQ